LPSPASSSHCAPRPRALARPTPASRTAPCPVGFAPVFRATSSWSGVGVGRLRGATGACECVRARTATRPARTTWLSNGDASSDVCCFTLAVRRRGFVATVVNLLLLAAVAAGDRVHTWLFPGAARERLLAQQRPARPRQHQTHTLSPHPPLRGHAAAASAAAATLTAAMPRAGRRRNPAASDCVPPVVAGCCCALPAAAPPPACCTGAPAAGTAGFAAPLAPPAPAPPCRPSASFLAGAPSSGMSARLQSPAARPARGQPARVWWCM
jgi:hypothetical protein